MPSYEKTPGWLDWCPRPSVPQFKPPPGAVDAHCHVFGPGEEFPFAPERKYTPCDASKAQLFALRDRLGFARNVIVQATCHGADNRAMADACRASGGKARGVATVRLGVTDRELEDLHHAGVRGVRFNFVKRLVDFTPRDELAEIAARIQPLGWHVVVYFEARDLPLLYDFFTALPTAVVVDHMGRPDVRKPIDGPEFGLFLDLMRRHENIWTKVSCPERLSISGPPALDGERNAYRDVVPFAVACSKLFRTACCGAPTGRTPTWMPTCPMTGCWWTSSRTSRSRPRCSGRCWSRTRCASTGRKKAGAKADGAGQALSRHPRHDDLRRRAGAPRLRAEPVLHEPDEGGEPRPLQGERARLSGRVADDRGAEAGGAASGISTRRSPQAATSTSSPRSARPTARLLADGRPA
jgi:2-pyrone-4,6-dicarboxylate lactonase